MTNKIYMLRLHGSRVFISLSSCLPLFNSVVVVVAAAANRFRAQFETLQMAAKI